VIHLESKGTNAMKVEPYLSFEGRADEAIEFYKKALGAKVVMLSRFKDAPPGACGGGAMAAPGEKVMHSALQIGNTTVMVSDGRCQGPAEFKGISLSISASTDADAERMFNGLAEGGKVSMPLGPSFFASRFGMVTDRFGVSWMVVSGAK
jgi:PhnB protein